MIDDVRNIIEISEMIIWAEKKDSLYVRKSVAALLGAISKWNRKITRRRAKEDKWD